MKSKVIYALNFIWSSFIAFSLPICLGWIYMSIIGSSKGYSYDLGDEAGISSLIGCFELLIWLVLALPSNIYVFKKTKEKGIYYIIIPAIIFIMLFILCVHLIGGWSEFGRFFHP